MAAAAQIRIIADDLTGALDAAAPLAARHGAFTVQWHAAAEPTEPRMALDTATREADRATSTRRVAAAADRWWREFPGVAFKKVDSVWRGNTAAEIAAAMRAGHFDTAIVAAAFPAQGRYTRGGAQWVERGGWAECVSPDLVGDLRAAGLRTVREDAVRPGDVVHVCDAETQDDLVAVVGRQRQRTGRVLWCGSAGLAHALAASLPMNSRITTPIPSGRPSGSVIVLVGTDDPVAQRQADLLALSEGVLETRLALDHAPDVPLTHGTERMQRDDPPILLIRFAVASGTPRGEVQALAQTALEHATQQLPRPALAIVTGGETLRALAHALGATALRVHGECSPGIAAAAWSDGSWAGLPVYTKSGRFGAPTLLVELATSACAPPLRDTTAGHQRSNTCRDLP